MTPALRQYQAPEATDVRRVTVTGRFYEAETPEPGPDGTIPGVLEIQYIAYGEQNRAGEVVDAGAFDEGPALMEQWAHNRSGPDVAVGDTRNVGGNAVWRGWFIDSTIGRDYRNTIRANGDVQEYSATFVILASRRVAGVLHITRARLLGISPVYRGVDAHTRTLRMQGQGGDQMTPEQRAQLEALLRSYGWDDERIRQYIDALETDDPPAPGNGDAPPAEPPPTDPPSDPPAGAAPADAPNDPPPAATPPEGAPAGGAAAPAAIPNITINNGGAPAATASPAPDVAPPATQYQQPVELNGLRQIREYAAHAGGQMAEMAERAIQSGVSEMAGFRQYMADAGRYRSTMIDLQRIRRYEGRVERQDRSDMMRYLAWQRGAIAESDAPRESVMHHVARDEGHAPMEGMLVLYGLQWVPPTVIDDFTLKHLGRRLSITGATAPTDVAALTGRGFEVDVPSSNPFPDGVRSYDAPSLAMLGAAHAYDEWDDGQFRQYASNTWSQVGVPHVEGEHIPPDRVLTDVLSLCNVRMMTGGQLEYWLQNDGATGPGDTAENAAPPEGNLVETRYTLTPGAWAWAIPQSILSALAEPASSGRRMAQALGAMDEAFNKRIVSNILGFTATRDGVAGVPNYVGTANAFKNDSASQGILALDFAQLEKKLWDVPVYGAYTVLPSNGFLAHARTAPLASGVGPMVQQGPSIMGTPYRFAGDFVPENIGTRSGVNLGPGDALEGDFRAFLQCLYTGMYVRISNTGGPTAGGTAGQVRPELWLVECHDIPRPNHFIEYHSKANT